MKVRLSAADYETVTARAATVGAMSRRIWWWRGCGRPSSALTVDRVLMRVWGQELRALRQQVYRVG